MKHSVIRTLVLLATAASLADEPVRLPALTDIDGHVHDEPTRSGDTAPVVVLAWTGTECPLARLYRPRLERLAKELGSRACFFLVNSNSHDSLEDIREASASCPKELAVIRDDAGKLARLLGARSTTEAFVLDRHRRIVYRGAVDDQYGFRRSGGRGARTYRKEAPTRHYLRDAIEAALSGKTPSLRKTDPLGCTLEWRPASEATSVSRTRERAVTFHEHVEPILQRHCQRCHRDGGNAPFSLVDYRSAHGWRRMIRDVVSERRMPPWGASPDYGRFANDGSLSDAQVATILEWVDAGAPRGNPENASPPRAFPAGWSIGQPDVTYTTPAFDVPAEGSLPYRYVRVPTRFAEDRWIEAMQIRSTTPEIVHHVLVFLENVPPPKPGVKRPWRPPFNPFSLLEGAKKSEYPKWIHRFRELIARDLMIGGGGGLNGYLASSSSGSAPMIYPEGRAKLLPAGATLVFQIHYTPNGKRRTSETTLALRLADQAPEEAVDTGAIATVAFRIPPGDDAYVVQATDRFPRDGLVLSLRPHMHVRGKSFRYVAELPDGSHRVLLEIPRWDFDWQLDYMLAEPLRLPRGTVLRAIGTYDNSAGNPYNPDPSKEVYFGLQTEDEMMIGYYDVVWLRPSR